MHHDVRLAASLMTELTVDVVDGLLGFKTLFVASLFIRLLYLLLLLDNRLFQVSLLREVVQVFKVVDLVDQIGTD